MNDDVVAIAALAAQRQRVCVMVLVKATPQPSTRYGDTVCVAGALLSGGPIRWIRLYPIPFRYLDSTAQFHKYETIDVELRPTSGDYRPESAKANLEAIKGGRVTAGWKGRAPIVEQLVGPTMCEMLAAVAKDIDAPSLGAIRPRDVDETLKFKPHGQWTAEQRRKMEAFAAQDSLFGAGQTQAILKPPKYEVRLRWRCETPTCGGHLQRILDWELTALQAKYRRSDTELRAAVQENFWTKLFNERKAPLIVTGQVL